jgi:hypothetical protein
MSRQRERFHLLRSVAGLPAAYAVWIVHHVIPHPVTKINSEKRIPEN